MTFPFWQRPSTTAALHLVGNTIIYTSLLYTIPVGVHTDLCVAAVGIGRNIRKDRRSQFSLQVADCAANYAIDQARARAAQHHRAARGAK